MHLIAFSFFELINMVSHYKSRENSVPRPRNENTFLINHTH